MKKIVFTFGRMNPPTIGHEKLADKIKKVASKEKADARIYLSHTNKPGSDPLSYNDKIKFANKAFGIAYKSNAKQIFQVVKELYKQGYTDVVMVVGSDRVKEFDSKLKQYNGKGDYDFDSIKVVSAGQRDPDAKGVEGMSGTKLRNLAKDGDQKTFMQGLASKLSAMDKKKVYALVAKNMKEGLMNIVVKHIVLPAITPNKVVPSKTKVTAPVPPKIKPHKIESVEFNEEVEEARKPLTVQQRVAIGRRMKKLAPKMARARKIKAKRMADPRQLKIRSQKAAMAIVRKKVAGEKGANYKNLSPSDKMNVDKMVQKKSALIQKIAKKQLPLIRKKEQERLKTLRGGSKTEQFNLTEDAENALRKKSEESGISYGILKKVFDRGMGAYETNPGSVRPNVTSPQQWAFARVNSFISGGKTRTTADADLWKQHSTNEEVNLDEMSWYLKVKAKLDQMTHPKGYNKMMQDYIAKVKKAKGSASGVAADVAKEYNIAPRNLIQYINKLVAKGVIPKELEAEYETEAYNPDEDFEGKINKKKLKEFYIPEAEYEGRKVKLNDPIRTSEVPSKKFKVYVKDPKSKNIKVVRFGDPNMDIKRDDPERRKSFRARHNCDDPGPITKARYWSCYQWRGAAKVDN